MNSLNSKAIFRKEGVKLFGITFFILCFKVTPLLGQEVDREKFRDKINQYKIGRYRNLTSNQLIKRVQSLSFSRLQDTGFSWDFQSYYENLDYVGLDIVCDRKLVNSIEVERIEDFFNSLNRAIIKTSPTIKCASDLKKTITLDSLNAIFDQLKRNRNFKNSSPGGQCFNRTYLISKTLNDLGVSSKQLVATGWIIGAFEFENYYGVEGYDIHNANIVNVMKDGKVEPYVVDPMFFDRPVPLEEYKRRTSVEGIENNYQIVTQTFHFSNYHPSKGVEEEEGCSYNEARLTIDSNQIEDLLNTLDKGKGTFYYNNEKGIYPQIRQDKASSRKEAISLYKERFKSR